MKLLKFDAFYPTNYLKSKQIECKNDIDKFNYSEYYDWLMKQRSYLSDFFTYRMNKYNWVAREFIGHDEILVQKLINEGLIERPSCFKGIEYLTENLSLLKLNDVLNLKFRNIMPEFNKYFHIESYIKNFDPDIILLREPTQLDGRFFDRYRKKKFIVSLIGCPTSHTINWDTKRSNLILTILPEYRDLFSLQGVNTVLFEYGVDSRIYNEVKTRRKNFDCVFVGLLGDPVQKMKSETMEFLAQNNRLIWWGIKGKEIEKYPNLVRTWQGQTLGIDMYKIYGSSRIVLNDYADTANGSNVNLRTKEVWSVGSFLLTRKPKNITEITDKKICEYYVSHNDCLEKIEYYLKNDEEREQIANNGREYAMKYHNYDDIVKVLMEKITESYLDWRKRYHQGVFEKYWRG